MSKYIILDEEAIKKDYPHIYEKYESTHVVKPVASVKVDLRKLAPNESVVYGDGKTFHFLLHKK